MLIEGKVVVVTGASRGIGRAVAITCAKEGADVVVNYAGAEEAAREVVAAIESEGRRAIAVGGDIADPETSRKLVDGAVEAFGRIDVLVNNAGICPFHSFLDMPHDVMRRTNEVNYYGAFYATQAVANQMVKQGDGGAIVTVSSISALVGGEMQTHYTPTKAADHSLMQSCAISLGPHGIRCNSVMPGAIQTDINRDDLTPDKLEYFEQRAPLGRVGQPDDIAGAVVFLASDYARYITGAGILIDGGLFVKLQ